MAETSEPKVVELGPDDNPVDSNVEDKENKVEEVGQDQGEGATKLNRGEKKCRKAM